MSFERLGLNRAGRFIYSIITMLKTVTKKKSSRLAGNLMTAAVALFLLGCFLVFLLPVAAEAVFQNRLSKAAGLPVQIGKVQFSLTSPRFSLSQIEVFNPKDFPAGPLARVREANVRYLPSLQFVGGFEFKRVEIEFEEFRLLRNEKGILNLPLLKSAGEKPVIEEVVFNLTSVTYTDLSGAQPVQQTYDLGLSNAVYRNVKGIPGIVEIIGWEILKRTGVEEKTGPVMPEIRPTAGSQAADQNEPAAAASLLPASSASTSEPSPAPSSPTAD